MCSILPSPPGLWEWRIQTANSVSICDYLGFSVPSYHPLTPDNTPFRSNPKSRTPHQGHMSYDVLNMSEAPVFHTLLGCPTRVHQGLSIPGLAVKILNILHHQPKHGGVPEYTRKMAGATTNEAPVGVVFDITCLPNLPNYGWSCQLTTLYRKAVSRIQL